MIIAMLAGLAGLAVIYIILQNRRVNKFRKRAGKGDKCWFYINNDRISGEIVYRQNNEVVIRYGNRNYEIRNITDIYI